ncbi:hypothetical protein I862_00605 [endosymbiont of Acanthamoeba sp. UWC8]|uniref:hypothetical protein n=1 Tax=endosymbiont of Acanthamoeba sp. UWC8 TaxID=86106 RepID=UPI0004D12431|nr:hypothetical protein [endosymbiont of Acanthamoeba sp. UWC8]AIF80686.1 hypothetical protein I862_00605 [endosymbiont of Acanthamoeba sp. UWC8]
MKRIDKCIDQPALEKCVDEQGLGVKYSLDNSLTTSNVEISLRLMAIDECIASYIERINNKKELIYSILVRRLNYSERDIVSKLNDISNYPLYESEIFRSARQQLCLSPLKVTLTTCLYTLTELLTEHNIRKSHNNLSEQEIEQVCIGIYEKNANYRHATNSNEGVMRSLSL